MRKLSELLEICLPYHICWGGNAIGMCNAGTRAMDNGVITYPERDKVARHCGNISGRMFLIRRIAEKQNIGFDFDVSTRKLFENPELFQAVKDFYESMIQDLKEKGQ